MIVIFCSSVCCTPSAKGHACSSRRRPGFHHPTSLPGICDGSSVGALGPTQNHAVVACEALGHSQDPTALEVLSAESSGAMRRSKWLSHAWPISKNLVFPLLAFLRGTGEALISIGLGRTWLALAFPQPIPIWTNEFGSALGQTHTFTLLSLLSYPQKQAIIRT